MGDTGTIPEAGDTQPVGGEDEMAKKAATGKKPEPKQTKPVDKDKKAKQPRVKKEPLKIKATKGVTVNETKYVITAEAGEKRMWVRGASVGLTHKVTGLKGFKAVSEEEAKKNHLGKTRMLGKVTSQDELNELVTKYFA
jgi:hypothetical protein